MFNKVDVQSALSRPGAGERMYAFAAELYPICRSITGPGLRETLSLIERRGIELNRTETASGAQVLDWTVPNEWTIRDAFVKNAKGERVIDFRSHNLHVLNYSAPIHARLPLAELKRRIFTLPDRPHAIPYRTSYYKEEWGFCASHDAVASLPEGEYEVLIDATLAPGSLTYGEHVHAGESEDEVLITAHACHPSLANDNCSGMALAAELIAAMAPLRTRYTYRFLFAPGTIGAIAWLANNLSKAARVKHGLVLSCVGDAGGPTYKRTRNGSALIDRAMSHVLRHAFPAPRIIDFFPYGYDERQFNSPGFKLDVGLFQRSQFGEFPEYHTSDDNLDFIRPKHLAESLQVVAAAVEILELDRRFVNLSPLGEPQLGKRGLYAAVGGDKEEYARNMAMLWVLNLSDGEHSLLDIAERANLPFATVAASAGALQQSGLLAPAA